MRSEKDWKIRLASIRFGKLRLPSIIFDYPLINSIIRIQLLFDYLASITSITWLRLLRLLGFDYIDFSSPVFRLLRFFRWIISPHVGVYWPSSYINGIWKQKGKKTSSSYINGIWKQKGKKTSSVKNERRLKLIRITPGIET